MGRQRFGRCAASCCPPWRGSAEAATPLNLASPSSSIGGKFPHQPLRGGHTIAAGDHERALAPVDPPVEAHADPALVADVGRHEKALRIGADEDRLAARRRLAPERRRAGVAAMHAEDLVAHAKGGLAPGLALFGLRQSEADRAQPVKRPQCHREEHQRCSPPSPCAGWRASPRLLARRTYMISASGRSILTLSAAISASSPSTTAWPDFPCDLKPTANRMASSVLPGKKISTGHHGIKHRPAIRA